MGEILYANELAKEIREQLKDQITEAVQQGIRNPELTVIVLGDDPGSASYIRGIQKSAGNIGIQVSVVKLDTNTTEEDLLNEVHCLNADDGVDGIMIQMPLPKHIRTQVILDAIDPKKDVDGGNKENVAGLYLKKDCFLPCTPEGIVYLLRAKQIPMDGVNTVILGRSQSVGRPLSQMMLDQNCTVTICHSHTKELGEITKRADILVVAIGRANFVKADMVKEGAVVIDVGVNQDEEGKLCGDVKIDEVLPKCSWITPVVKGVGSLTTASLLEHVVRSWKRRTLYGVSTK